MKEENPKKKKNLSTIVMVWPRKRWGYVLGRERDDSDTYVSPSVPPWFTHFFEVGKGLEEYLCQRETFFIYVCNTDKATQINDFRIWMNLDQ